jgi:hypothetical protein
MAIRDAFEINYVYLAHELERLEALANSDDVSKAIALAELNDANAFLNALVGTTSNISDRINNAVTNATPTVGETPVAPPQRGGK